MKTIHFKLLGSILIVALVLAGCIKKSNDASLKSITVNGTVVNGFNPDSLNYHIEVDAANSTIPVVIAEATNANASVQITNTSSLPGSTTIIVTAEDGSTKRTYSLNFGYFLTKAPELPPASTFVIDMSTFTGNQQKSIAVDDTTKKTNFGFAAFTVGVWNIVITLGMAIPVASFLESFKHEAVQVETGHWKWSYNFYANNILHLAELHGIVSDSIRWEMYITKEGSFTNFKWYTGTSDLLSTNGYWILYQAPDKPQPLLRIDWSRNPADSTGETQYTNIIPGGTENGGYIHYGVNHDIPFDAFYNIYNKGKDNLTEIQWNRTTIEGRIKDTLIFNDNNWHCWNSLQYNMICQ